jgi:flavodoxin
MARTLIVFYSRTGVTQHVARQLAQRLDADLSVIEDVRPRTGMLGYVRSALEAVQSGLPGIRRAAIDPASYELVVLGTPVWVGHLSSPMRRFLHDRGPELPRVAFFCTQGGRGAETVFREMRELLGKDPVATCALTDHEVFAEDHTQKIDAFVERLGEGPEGAPPRRSQGTPAAHRIGG